MIEGDLSEARQERKRKYRLLSPQKSKGLKVDPFLSFSASHFVLLVSYFTMVETTLATLCEDGSVAELAHHHFAVQHRTATPVMYVLSSLTVQNAGQLSKLN